uniref:Uncharacterized protein n=1 Tax=Arundo donax TaxID=35708 RepID=A0A0A9ETT4_ARUDO
MTVSLKRRVPSMNLVTVGNSSRSSWKMLEKWRNKWKRNRTKVIQQMPKTKLRMGTLLWWMEVRRRARMILKQNRGNLFLLSKRKEKLGLSARRSFHATKMLWEGYGWYPYSSFATH